MTLEQLPRAHLKNELILERRRLRNFKTYQYLSNEMNISLGKVFACSQQPLQRYISKWNELREQPKTLDGPNHGWLWRKITMAVMKWNGQDVELTSALKIPQNRYILGWEAYQDTLCKWTNLLSSWLVGGAREISRQLCLKLNLVWLWSGDLSIFSQITSYLGC